MIPSIFNNVIGPVMRGPSSSHTAASWRIARTCLDILDEPLKKALIEFDKDGAWATNFEEQGTVLGIDGGLLGFDITDPRMKDSRQLIEESALSINYKISSFKTEHVNTVKITLEGKNGHTIMIMAASLGGGSFKIYQLNDFEVDIRGDYHELLIINNASTKILNDIKNRLVFNSQMLQSKEGHNNILNIKTSVELPSDTIRELETLLDGETTILIKPILPIVSGKDSAPPFTTIQSLIEYSEKENQSLGDIGLLYEKCLSGLPESVLLHKMETIIKHIDDSIKTGLEGTVYKDRILQHQSHLLKKAEDDGRIPVNSIMNSIISNVTAIMEVKSSLGVFVANPTAGSCGTVGGVVKAISEQINPTREELIKAYFAAGIIGVYFALGPGFSAEEHGCQVECGAASGMAAAALVQLYGGSAKQSLDAASMAIQNMLGLICDPVADRVEVPCLGKNVSAAMNAYASANMLISGFNAIIPIDEVIQTVSRVSQQMPSCVKCSGTGGLAITQTALELKLKLKENTFD